MDARSLIIGIFVTAIARASNPQTGGESIIMPEPAFYAALSRAAAKMGIYLYVFAAQTCKDDKGWLEGYRYIGREWTAVQAPFPHIVYDRAFCTLSGQRQQCRATLDALYARKPFLQLNGNLPSKLSVYEALLKDSRIAPYLPPTELCQSVRQAMGIVDRHALGVVIKPAGGMQGRGIVRIRRSLLHRGFAAEGRTLGNKPFVKIFEDEDKLKGWLTAYMSKGSLLAQPYLELTDSSETPFDIRVLLQKDDSGRWQTTGSAVRLGRKNSLTSNLHGGGSSRQAHAWLTAALGEAEAEHLLSQIHIITHHTAKKLEDCFGRFAELAFDFGIDRSGAIWLLEANAKPGRSVFKLNGDQEAERCSIERPLLYGRLLSRRLLPSFVTNESANGRQYHSNEIKRLRPLNVQEVHR